MNAWVKFYDGRWCLTHSVARIRTAALCSGDEELRRKGLYYLPRSLRCYVLGLDPNLL